MDIANLQRLIDLIGAKLDGLPVLPSLDRSEERWQAMKHRTAAVDALMAELAAAEGAKIRPGGSWETAMIKLAGISCTCTQGSEGVLRNWRVAARKKIDQLRGGQ